MLTFDSAPCGLTRSSVFRLSAPAYLDTPRLQDSGLVFAPGLGSGAPLHYSPNGASHTNFAWAAHAGLS